jgi:hypothetical protein
LAAFFFLVDFFTAMNLPPFLLRLVIDRHFGNFLPDAVQNRDNSGLIRSRIGRDLPSDSGGAPDSVLIVSQSSPVGSINRWQ